MNKLRKVVAIVVLSTSVMASVAPAAAHQKTPGPIKPTVTVTGDPSQWGLEAGDVSLTRKVNEYEGQH